LTEDSGRRKEIESSLGSIVEISEKWLARLRRRQWEVRLVTSFITAILIFFATLVIGTILILVSAGVIGPTVSSAAISTNFANFVQQHPGFIFEAAFPAFLTAPSGGIITYIVMRIRHEKKMKELAALIAQMKKRIAFEQKNQPLQHNEAATANQQEAGVLGDAFTLTDQIFTLLPNLARKRNQDSLLFGFAAFLVALFGGNFAVAILVGVIVWIYFRYETRKTYGEQIAKFEEQRRIFEQRKKEFIETL
jgi:hypothetical protein